MTGHWIQEHTSKLFSSLLWCTWFIVLCITNHVGYSSSFLNMSSLPCLRLLQISSLWWENAPCCCSLALSSGTITSERPFLTALSKVWSLHFSCVARSSLFHGMWGARPSVMKITDRHHFYDRLVFRSVDMPCFMTVSRLTSLSCLPYLCVKQSWTPLQVRLWGWARTAGTL